jgi:signal transduction histidine kinase/CheY-like chemotaxis protein/sugar lactone lactonase YvrE
MFASTMLVLLLSAQSERVSVTARGPAGPDAGLQIHPYFHTLGVADGLPSNRVYKVVQDRNGYLWFGTRDGLARYDGVGFQVWRHNANDPASLSADDVSALYVDRDNRIWCGGEDSGLNMLDAKREHFTHFRHDPEQPQSLSGSDVWAIAGDADGAIWVGTYAGGVDKLERAAQGSATPTFTHFRHADADGESISSDNILNLTFDRRGRLWIGTDTGLDRRDADGHIRHIDLSALPGTGAINVSTLLENEDGSFLAGTHRGVAKIDADLKAQAFATDALADPVVYALARDADKGLWIAGRRGVTHLDAAGTVRHYSENASLPGSLPGTNVFDVLRDHEGGLWFSTFEGGVAQLAPHWRNFALFRNDPTDPSSLSANRIQGLGLDAAGGIWSVDVNHGIDRLDPASGKVEHFATRWSVPDLTLTAVFPDRAGQLWVGLARGLRVYNLQNGKFDDLPVAAASTEALAPGLVYSIVQAADGAIWASSSASEGGVHRIDPLSHRIERFDSANAGLRNAEINQLGFARDQRLLVAHKAGLDVFDAATRRFNAVAGAPNQAVLEFAFAADGSLWLQVNGALEHYRVEPTRISLIEHIGAADGWPTLNVGGMQIDDRGTLWVSSARGLWRYDPVTHAIRLFNSHDGLASSEFHRIALVQRADGGIFGATLGGIVGFQPARLSESLQAPPLLLAAGTVRREGRDIALDVDAGEIPLRWNDRDLRLSARALSFANSSALRYQWRLSGVDPDWIDTANRGEREYAQIRPGRHHLRVRAANADGVWSEITPLVIEQSAPPWATRSAYLAYVLAAFLLGWLAVRLSRQRIERRHAFELAEQQRNFAQTTSAAKTSFLATMGHEIRTPMTGVLGMTELLLRTPLDAQQRSFAQAIQLSGNMMLRLVNDSLDLARIEAGKLELEDAPLDLHALIGEIASLAQTLVQAKGLTFRYAIASNAPRHVHGDAVRFKQIVLNLVNNAIKFTESGCVAIELARAAGGQVEVSVSDTGPGIAEATRLRLFQRFEQVQGTQQRFGGSGLGLAICRELVALMGGEIRLDSQVGQGSTFIVILPLREVDVDADRSSLRTDMAPVAEPSEGLHILLVEDDATVALVVIGLLEAQGHRVRHVVNGLAALIEIEAADYEAALLDLDLPGIDGLTLARMLRANEQRRSLPRMPLIGVSARSIGDEEALCLAAGMDAFLRKPLSGAVLAEALKTYTRGRGHSDG